MTFLETLGENITFIGLLYHSPNLKTNMPILLFHKYAPLHTDITISEEGERRMSIEICHRSVVHNKDILSPRQYCNTTFFIKYIR